MSYLLSFENEKLKVAKQLPNDVDFCCMLNEKEAVFTNFYEAELLCNELSIAKKRSKSTISPRIGEP